jgi:hypothetical protein
MNTGKKNSYREILLQLLEELFSKIEPEPAPSAVISDIEHWLYVGLKGGASLRFFSRPESDFFLNSQAMHYCNFNAAVHGSVHLFTYFDMQLEMNFTYDYAPFIYFSSLGNVDTTPFYTLYLTVPLLLRSNIRKGNLLAGIFGGAYMILPLGQMKNDRMGGSFGYAIDLPLGYTAGVNSGMKLGPGYLFLDIRWAADLGKQIKLESAEPLYQRSMVTFNIGYEFGIIEKQKTTPKPKQVKPKKPEKAKQGAVLPEEIPLKEEAPLEAENGHIIPEPEMVEPEAVIPETPPEEAPLEAENGHIIPEPETVEPEAAVPETPPEEAPLEAENGHIIPEPETAAPEEPLPEELIPQGSTD